MSDISADPQRFALLQERLCSHYERVFPDSLAPRTVIVNPSLSMDLEVLSKITGLQHYEERMLCMLLLLRLPRTHVIYLTSLPVDPEIIDYYLHLLPGIPSGHARRRLTLLSCRDASAVPLSRKILDRPRLMQRLRAAIPDPENTHMSCFNVSELERQLALQLDVPIYGCDPSISDPGCKSGSREVFKKAGIEVSPGFERLRDELDVFEAVSELKLLHPDLRRVVVKLEEGASGEGNAVVSLEEAPGKSGLAKWVAAELPARIIFEAQGETWEEFQEKFRNMGGIVEAFVEGKGKVSPSVQCRIDPAHRIEMISTHDQVLGGPSGQVFLGCTFPAAPDYRLQIQEAGLRVSEVLRDLGVIGRFGIDFVSVPDAAAEGGWRHYAIEINLRKGGTTHPFMMLQFLTDGSYDTETGRFHTPVGQERCYFASDNLKNPTYRGLLPEDLIEIMVDHQLHFHATTQQGVAFHLIGSLSEFGKLGAICVSETVEASRKLYAETVEILDQEALPQALERGKIS